MNYLFLVTGEIGYSMHFHRIFDTLEKAIKHGAQILADQEKLREIGTWKEEHNLTKYDINRMRKE